jgi:pimeloyl-ACP methyl ester carboxylesterase
MDLSRAAAAPSTRADARRPRRGVVTGAFAARTGTYTDEWLHLNGVWAHFQDWPDGRDEAGDETSRSETILLLHGLTQQSHAFDAAAARLSRRHRCLALDLRGRGESGWAAGTYDVRHYVADVVALLDALGLDAVHVLGTSLGGLIGLSLAGVAPARLRSLALNDIGPEIDPRGAARVAAYTASIPERFPDLAAAARWALAQYPWLRGLASEAVTEAIRWAVRRTPDGGWRFKCDPAVGRVPRPAPEVARAAGQAWWTALEALRCPVLLVRGAESDILSRETAGEMEVRQPRLRRVDVEGIGHAPSLAEPAAVAALDAFYLAGSRAEP